MEFQSCAVGNPNAEQWATPWVEVERKATGRVSRFWASSSGPPALARVRGPNSDRATWAALKTGQGGRSIAAIGLAKFRTCAMCRFFLRTRLRYLKLDLAPH